MSEMGQKWIQLKTWMLHLKRKQLDSPINPDLNNYKQGFNDAVEMCIRFMEASELEPSPTIPTGTTRGMWKKEGP